MWLDGVGHLLKLVTSRVTARGWDVLERPLSRVVSFYNVLLTKLIIGVLSLVSRVGHIRKYDQRKSCFMCVCVLVNGPY